MKKNKAEKFHPGSYLKDYLKVANITVQELSEVTKIEKQKLEDIVNEKAPITEEVALKLSTYMDCSSALWINLQEEYDNQKYGLAELTSDLKLTDIKYFKGKKEVKNYLQDILSKSKITMFIYHNGEVNWDRLFQHAKEKTLFAIDDQAFVLFEDNDDE